MLLYLQYNDELFNTELIDSVVTAEIPEENLYPELYKLVKQHIVGWMQEHPISAPGWRTTYLGAGFKNDLSQTRFLFLWFCSGSTARL